MITIKDVLQSRQKKSYGADLVPDGWPIRPCCNKATSTHVGIFFSKWFRSPSVCAVHTRVSKHLGPQLHNDTITNWQHTSLPDLRGNMIRQIPEKKMLSMCSNFAFLWWLCIVKTVTIKGTSQKIKKTTTKQMTFLQRKAIIAVWDKTFLFTSRLLHKTLSCVD